MRSLKAIWCMFLAVLSPEMGRAEAGMEEEK